MKKLFLSLPLVWQAFAGEYAVLQNGFRIYADRHEVLESTIRLHTATGSMDLPSQDIARFEVEEFVRPEPQPAALPEVVVAPVVTPEALIQEAAARHGLRPEFVQSVASVESAYRQEAVSPKGAIGLMQLMPGTARELGANPHDAAENADAGTRYLKQLLLKYADRPDAVQLALAAYNAGPGAVDRYGRVPPYRETRQYVEKVLRKYLSELQANSMNRSKS